jgi:hydroxyethylthiazole kinase-like uncharacterized protein yjeF
MRYKEIVIPRAEALELSQFQEMDYNAVENYDLPIELMMENAGLQLAKLIVDASNDTTAKILIGVGNGNNGGGGLVAARRLAAWGYSVYLDIFTEITKELPLKQLNRAVKFGVNKEMVGQPDIWVDAYLGFSQRLPMAKKLTEIIKEANKFAGPKISLDIPTGYLGDVNAPYFKTDKVLSLAAAKRILYDLPKSTDIYIADLGIPAAVYQKFNIDFPPFHLNTILKVIT